MSDALISAGLRFAGSLMPDLYGPPAAVLFPFGHIVCDVAPPHVRNLYAVPTVAKFKSDIDDLCRTSRPLKLEELGDLPRARHGKTSERRFLLSFDDGMREVYEVIAPILREKGLPAVLFLNSATIDNKRLMWRHKISLVMEQAKQNPGRIPPQLGDRPEKSLQAKLNALRYSDGSLIDELAAFFEIDFEDYLRRQRPYLTTEEVKDLARWGFEIGAHSASHPYFCELGSADQEKEVSACVDFIRSLGLPCRCFAFPFHDDGVSVSLFQYMSGQNLDLSFGTSEARVDSIAFSFQRFALDGGHAQISLRSTLNQLSAKSLLRMVTGTRTILRNQ